MPYVILYGERAAWVLERVESGEYSALRTCILTLEQDPYPPASRLAPLVIPGRMTYPAAYVCDRWRIGYRVLGTAFIAIEDIGLGWPPRP